MTIAERPILRDLDFEIRPGQWMALLGPNGAGKTTLMRILGLLTAPTAGRLEQFGRAVSHDDVTARARLGLVGHTSMLYRALSAFENLVFFARLYGVPDPRGRARELLEQIGLAARAHDPVAALSRGMTQRVSIARALVNDPALLLADEPFVGLDAPSCRIVEHMFRDLHRAGTTIVISDHDLGRSLALAEHVMVLRDGRLVRDEPAEGLDAESVLAEISPR
jgi:ABC-type multidrug transport system ATPase subunit